MQQTAQLMHATPAVEVIRLETFLDLGGFEPTHGVFDIQQNC